MIQLEIPGYQTIAVKHITFDYNGTLAVDGILAEGVKEKLIDLSKRDVELYIITADTFGTVQKQCEGLPVKIEVFAKDNIAAKKQNFVEKLGKETNIAVGNGRNDLDMFEKSVLAIVVMGKEGCCAKSLMAADIVVNNPLDALDLLLKNDRIVATLRT